METTNELLEIGALQPHPRNYNRHPAEQVRKLAKSLRKMGQVRSIVVWRGTILAGHGVVEAAKSLKWKTIRADVLPDEYPEELALAYVAADNDLARQGDPDLAQLLGILEESRAADEELLEAMGFDADEFAALLAEVGGETKAGELVDAEPQIDRAEELRTKWCVETGQLWQLGDHRLICGDCTAPAVVKRVMGGGKAGLLFTDPPYGVKRDKGFGGAVGFGGNGAPIPRRQYSDEWDSDRPSQETLAQLITFSEAAIIFGGNFFADILPRSTHWIVWDKQNTMPTFGDCELAWTNLDRHSVKKYSIVYNGLIGKEKERYHPTQKPVTLMAEILKDYTVDNAVVFDPFLGSGTTLIACEQLGRRCRAVEISPAYVSVALERWSTVTAKVPVLLD